MATLILGDSHIELQKLDACSVDSLVTDPPAGIAFMNKKFDTFSSRESFISSMRDIFKECLRVMKPGAHGFVWALPRTSHWTATALEDAGFEVRDVITHLFGSGFPKSHNVGKSIDREANAPREIVGYIRTKDIKRNVSHDIALGKTDRQSKWCTGSPSIMIDHPITESATEDAKTWQGWGTALKPASEHWILVRKPCSEKTVAANVLKFGTGAINVDASRIGSEPRTSAIFGTVMKRGPSSECFGRFPANLVLSHSDHCTFQDVSDRGFHGDTIETITSRWHCVEECPVRMLDAQSGIKDNGKFSKSGSRNLKGHSRCMNAFDQSVKNAPDNYGDSGGASRFFYVAKASQSERNAGCEGLVAKNVHRFDEGIGEGLHPKVPVVEKNTHPTVKSKKFMNYLITMITPPLGTVLDPFLGSGSTGVAAIEAGFKFIGIEKEHDYMAIAKARIEHVETQRYARG